MRIELEVVASLIPKEMKIHPNLCKNNTTLKHSIGSKCQKL